MSDETPKDFLQFLQAFNTGASSFYFLDEFMLNNDDIFKNKTNAIGPLASMIHSRFQQGCLDLLSIKEARMPGYIKEDEEEKLNRTLLRDVTRDLDRNTSLTGDSKLTTIDIAKEMLEKVFVPLSSTALKFQEKLKS